MENKLVFCEGVQSRGLATLVREHWHRQTQFALDAEQLNFLAQAQVLLAGAAERGAMQEVVRLLIALHVKFFVPSKSNPIQPSLLKTDFCSSLQFIMCPSVRASRTWKSV